MSSRSLLGAPWHMTPNEPTTQSLLAGLRDQGAIDGDLALHALIDADLNRNG